MDTRKLEQLSKLLDSPKRIVIVPHKNPDGDALGSCLGLSSFLQQKGHEATVVSPNDYPNFLKWMPGEATVLKFDQNQEQAQTLLDAAELIFTLDFNSFSRVGAMEPALSKATAEFVMIDHHQQPDDYAAYTESNVNMSSTAEMIYQFIDRLDAVKAITPEIATCLYTGIMTDTGSFRFPSTTSQTHRVIADLIDKGAQNASIHQEIYDTNSFDKLQLLGVALQNLKVEEKYHTAYITLSQEELDKHHFKKGDTEGFVNYALSVKNIIFAAIFIENKADKIVKISLRSKGDFNVNEFARAHFQGGGHRNAAGGKSDDSLKETIEKFITLLPEYKTELA